MASQHTPIYVELESVAELVTLGTATIQRMVACNEFPKPRQLSGRRVAWLYREVVEWSETRPVSDLPPPPNSGARRGRVFVKDLPSGEAGSET
jgi:prophage regulatory protein